MNARRNKSYYFLSFFQNFDFHNSYPAYVAKECIFFKILEFIEKMLWECPQAAFI